MDATGVEPISPESRPEPGKMRKLPPPRPLFSEASVRFVLEGTREILEGKAFLSTAAHGAAFEEDFASWCGVSHGVACSSGTTALEIALRCLDVAGGEVLVPSLTFAATAYAVQHAGARPVFVDCGPDMQLDPEDAARKIGPETRAVVTVHIGGYISESMPRLAELCAERDVPLIEDAAHAHGASLEGRMAGSFGRISAFSFFSTKVVASGEGGILVTDDEAMAERARILRNQGKVRNSNYHEGSGLSARLTEMQALVLRAQLSEAEDQIAARRRLARVYDARIPEIEGVSPLPQSVDLAANYYKYIVLLDQPGRQEECKSLLKEHWGVGLTGFVYELPLHRQPAFAAAAEGVSCPVADDVARRHVCLPIHPEMDEEDAAYVLRALSDVAPTLRRPLEEEAPFLLP